MKSLLLIFIVLFAIHCGSSNNSPIVKILNGEQQSNGKDSLDQLIADSMEMVANCTSHLEKIFLDETDTIKAERRVAWPNESREPDTSRLFHYYPSAQFKLKQLDTGPGEVIDYTLPNGASVYQNARTNFSYFNQGSYAEVTGEVLLETSKVPMTIQVADVAVYLPAHCKLNVKHRSHDSTFSFATLEGIVQLTRNGEVTMVKTNQKAVCDYANEITISPCDPDEVRAWALALISSETITLPSVLQILGDWYDKKFVIKDPQNVKKRGFGCRYAPIKLDQMIKMIETSFNVQFLISEGDKIVFFAKK